MKYYHPERQLQNRIKLSYYRKLLGQQKLAKILNTTTLSVRNWEQGRFKLREEIIQAIESWDKIHAQVNAEGQIHFVF